MSDLVDRLNAALEGRYHIERQLGEGGMATVCLARDLKHNRSVALKVLKPELAAVVGAERFLAEIETTANLQHPNILPLFDSGEADGFLFYVMPYVEGETLRQKLDREHQLPVDEAVQIAKNVAEALEYAHTHGVIHRDIKPANILLQAGKPVISDFGIALAVGVAGGGRLTETGLSLGTPHYMSPEQATGDQTVGATTDIYALGCVLYEMLVGEPPYTGSTAQAILGKIIAGKLASAREHRRSVPANVDAAIRKSLEKLPADRFTSAADFARALGDAGFRYGTGTAATGAGTVGPWNRLSVVTTGLALIFAGLAVWQLLSSGTPSSRAPVARFEAPFRAGQGPVDFNTGFDLSPDGSLLVYVGPGADPADPSGRQLWVRRWSDLDATPLRGTDAAIWPAVSPDGARLAFEQGREIKVMALSGGSATTLAEGIIPRWGPDGYVYFGALPGGSGPIQRVPATGGPVEVVRPWTEGDARQVVWDVLPPGDVALTQLIPAGASTSSPYVGLLRIDTGEMTELLPDAATPHFTTTGLIVFEARDSSLMAVPFDPRSEKLGEPVRVKENLNGFVGNADRFALSRTGTLVTAPGPPGQEGGREFLWVSRAGDADPLPIPPAWYDYPHVSPDGSHLLASVSQADGTADLWTYDVGSGAALRLTYGDRNTQALWLPDGRRIVFNSTKDAPPPPSSPIGNWFGNLYVVPADRSREPERLNTTDESQFISGVSPDGRTLVYTNLINNDQWEIRGVPSDFSAEPEALVSGPYHRGMGTISPDGRWLAYRSDESGEVGAWDIFVQPFPGPGAKVPVSVGGGNEPVWSRDGRELFYRRPDGMLMAASIAGDETPRVTGRTPLFSTVGYYTGVVPSYDVAPDGRYLMMRPYQADPVDAEASAPKLVVTLNWFDELEARVPN